MEETTGHYLLGISTRVELETHPKLGLSWEGYALKEVIKATEPDQVYFWATHSGAELDLLIIKGGKQYGAEFKRVDAPKVTVSMRTALEDLQLEHLAVIYPGILRYPLAEKITAVPLQKVANATKDPDGPGSIFRQ